MKGADHLQSSQACPRECTLTFVFMLVFFARIKEGISHPLFPRPLCLTLITFKLTDLCLRDELSWFTIPRIFDTKLSIHTGFEMEKECLNIPRLNLPLTSDHDASSPLVAHSTPNLVPRPPATSLKISHVPSLRQSNTALVPQVTPSMIGKKSSSGDLPYKKILRGRLGVRSFHDVQCKSSKCIEPPGSQTFRSTMQVLNGRCGSLSARASKSAPSFDMNRVSESASSWYERRSQALCNFSAPLFGFCSSPTDDQTGTDHKLKGTARLRPHSSGQALTFPATSVPVVHARPSTSIIVPQKSTNTPRGDEIFHMHHGKQLICQSETPGVNDSSRRVHTESSTTVSEIATQISMVTQVASKLTEKIRPQQENMFLFPSLGTDSPSLGPHASNPLNAIPTLEQALAELTKGQPLKKFSHSSQRVAVKVLRLNSNAELLIDDELQERVVAIFDGLSPFAPPKRSLLSEDDFVPKYTFNPSMAFHILLMNEEFIDVIADSTWTKQCWMTGIRLMLAQMKSKFQSLPIRLPDFDTDDLAEEALRRLKWLEFLRATTDRLEDERKRKESVLLSLELKEKETSEMYDEITKPIGLDRIADLNNCVARMEFLNIQLDQGGITLKHQEIEQSETTQVCKTHLQEMSSIVADANSYVQFIRSQWTEVVQQTRRLEIERNCFKDFCFRNRKEILDRMKHRRQFHQQIKNELEAMEFTEKNRGAAIMERSRKNESFIDDRHKRNLGANLGLLTFFQGGIDSSLALSLPKCSYVDNHSQNSFQLLRGSLVPTSMPPKGHHLTLKSGFEWMMVNAGIEDLSSFAQHVIAQKAVTVALRAGSEASLSELEIKNENLNQALSELSLVHSASETTSSDDIPDLSNLISSSVSKLRDFEVAIRWHQRKEALFIGYTEEARIACYNINQRIGSALSLYPASKPVSVEADIKSRTKFFRRAAEMSNEPLLTSLFSNLFKQYDLLLSCNDSSLSESPAVDNLVELTLHNTRVEVKDSADEFSELQSENLVDPVVASIVSTCHDGLLSAQPAKPKSSGGVIPTAPTVQHFKYRKAESKKFTIPRMFEHLEWETIRAPDTSSTTIGLYDKNGRRVRIARKKDQIPVVDQPEDASSDDSTDAPGFDNLKVVSKRFIKEQARKFCQVNMLAQTHNSAHASN